MRNFIVHKYFQTQYYLSFLENMLIGIRKKFLLLWMVFELALIIVHLITSPYVPRQNAIRHLQKK